MLFNPKALVRQLHRTSLPCSNLSAWPNIAPTCARLFLLERDGRSYRCCSPSRTRLCGIPPRDNRRDKHRKVTSNSDADDGAAAYGMDCTWLTVRHAPVIASLPSPDSGSRGAGLVSQCSLHPPTSLEVFRRPDHEMPKLPVVRSRKSRVSGQPSQVAGALIPDNTQHSWRDDVGRGSEIGR